jgi:hypothetical protein
MRPRAKVSALLYAIAIVAGLQSRHAKCPGFVRNGLGTLGFTALKPHGDAFDTRAGDFVYHYAFDARGVLCACQASRNRE